jgi:hypothetical protein
MDGAESIEKALLRLPPGQGLPVGRAIEKETDLLGWICGHGCSGHEEESGITVQVGRLIPAQVNDLDAIPALAKRNPPVEWILLRNGVFRNLLSALDL